MKSLCWLEVKSKKTINMLIANKIYKKYLKTK